MSGRRSNATCIAWEARNCRAVRTIYSIRSTHAASVLPWSFEVIRTIVAWVVAWTNDLTSHVTHAVVAHTAVYRTIVIWMNRSTWTWNTWTHTRYIYPTHSAEHGTTTVVIESARRCKEEMIHATVVQIDAEAPAMVVECDWTIEVIVCHQKCPLALCEKAAECIVACIHDFHIVIITITKGNCVEIIVYATDVVVVDIIQVVNESCTES